MTKVKQEDLKQNIFDNCIILQQLFGLDNGLEIFVRSNVVVYGLLNVNKTFYSVEPHKRLSNICVFKTSITIAFLSDLTRELISLLNSRNKEINVNSDISFIEYSPNRDNSKTLLQQKINHERIKGHMVFSHDKSTKPVKKTLNPISFNDKDYY